MNTLMWLDILFAKVENCGQRDNEWLGKIRASYVEKMLSYVISLNSLIAS